ncbi:MAG: hypothetical protein AUG09_06690 [Acidobacteria bacterium 13_1_20CM_2_68_7]|nr:MAG: hypothetical protein AUG09_06690 [Acidobacteria bacterium 13_1_20CM_2_68_7]
MAREKSLPLDPLEQPDRLTRLWRRLFGAPRDVQDPGIFHKISLIAFLAWVGLGADGLSSSAYGPAEAFKNLVARNPLTGRMEGQWYLAIFLALATATTVFVISYAYSRVIEQFPHGGGGYVVATKLLGRQAGVVSGCALLVDYILTITVSVAAGGDALFDLLPGALRTNLDLKLLCEVTVLGALLVMNLRGVKESVEAVAPIFLVFVITHLFLIVVGIGTHAVRVPEVTQQVTTGLQEGWHTFGRWGLFVIFLRAFALGGGTFTGIEAVSNGITIMREPKVQTGKRTMMYMAASLAFTASGILVCFLLFDVQTFFGLPGGEQAGMTLNGVLAERFAGGWHLGSFPLGSVFVKLTMVSEAALLFVAAQTGFVDGPRVMSNMAIDSWLPHRFASLSDRLTTKDGVILMGCAATALLLLTRGRVDTLVIMYSINVFATFSLTEMGMCRFWIRSRGKHQDWVRHISVHVVGLILCLTILTITVVEKFEQGAWKTLLITCLLVGACTWVRGHYRTVELRVRELDRHLLDLEPVRRRGGEPDPRKPTAVLLVRDYGGMGMHLLLSLQRMFPGYYRNVIFVSVAVIDSGHFKGKEEISALRTQVEESLAKFVDLARRQGLNAGSATMVTTDPVDGLYRVCVDLAKNNETAYQVQRRLQWKGLPMTVLPLRTGEDAPSLAALAKTPEPGTRG